jgi:hypothetical protein
LTRIPTNYADGVMWLQGNRYPEKNKQDRVIAHLENRGVVLNGKEAAVDVLSSDKIRKVNTEDWHEGLILLSTP